MPAQAERGWRSSCAHRAAWLLHDHQKSTGWDEELCQRLARGDESRTRESGAEWSNFSEGGVSWRSHPLHFPWIASCKYWSHMTPGLI